MSVLVRASLFALLAPLFALAVDKNSDTISGEELRSAAVELGQQIDAARTEGNTSESVEHWLRECKALDQRAREARQGAEAAAGENEQALERLYRSSSWGGLNFALAASRYWQSWLYLDRFALTASPSDLSAARHGFQTTLVLIVYPGLVRGSWLGLGYVALAEDDLPTARAWFDRVALQDDALADIARREIELISALEQPTVAALDKLDAATADALEAEALALLERHGKSLDGARAAAERLRQLEAAGELTPERVKRLLVFRNEVIGQPVGPVGYLVSAEDALDNAQYYTAVEKFAAFFAALDEERAAAFVDYRLRYADALLLSGLYERSIAELAPRMDQLADQVTAHSLLHVAHAMRFAAQGGAPRREAYRQAADKAGDAGATFSRQLLGGNLQAASAQAKKAKREENPWFLRLPAFELVYREFGSTASTAALRNAQAKLGLQLVQQFDRQTRRLPWVRLATAELQAQLEPDVQRLGAQLDKLADDFTREGIDMNDALMRIRLDYLKQRDPAQLVEMLRTLQPPLSDELGLQLLATVLPCNETGWCLPATRQLLRIYPPGSDARLAVQLERIRLLSATGRDMDSYTESRVMVADYPHSGDAWRLYALSCERVGRAGDADEAYARLTKGVPLGSAVWEEAQLARLHLRLGAGAEQEACALRQTVLQHPATLAKLDDVLADRGVSCLLPDKLL
jgi:hypothetical protein